MGGCSVHARVCVFKRQGEALGLKNPSPEHPSEGRSTAESKQTRTACRRTATDSHAEKSGSGAGGAGAGAAGGRVVSGAAAEGRSTAASQQTCVMWS